MIVYLENQQHIDMEEKKVLTVEEIKNLLNELGYDDAVVFDNNLGYDYASAFVGFSEDGRAIYDYELMIKHIVDSGDDMDEEAAIEWIDYNTIRALPYAGEMAPIIMYPIDRYL